MMRFKGTRAWPIETKSRAWETGKSKQAMNPGTLCLFVFVLLEQEQNFSAVQTQKTILIQRKLTLRTKKN